MWVLSWFPITLLLYILIFIYKVFLYAYVLLVFFLYFEQSLSYQFDSYKIYCEVLWQQNWEWGWQVNRSRCCFNDTCPTWYLLINHLLNINCSVLFFLYFELYRSPVQICTCTGGLTGKCSNSVHMISTASYLICH